VSLALAAMTAFAADFRHVSAVTADRLAAFAADFGHMLTILADRRATLSPDLGHVLAIAAHCFAALAPDFRHVSAILADGHSTLSTRFAGLLGRKLMRPALHVGCLSPLARDLALPLCIHRGKAAPRFFCHGDALL
jgi:hypothetical protein